ncbi:MAG: A/G-specific adenine glycosylase [Aerococcus sp.]|nr:A/G-specific adenine glycosylase [Aerococcus sp.]
MTTHNQVERPEDWIGRSAILDVGGTIEEIQIWGPRTIDAFQKTLLDWYDREGRDLPWRRTRNPYHIWLSEIMLQQTQVDTVKDYYRRFLEHFPTIEALARADESELLKVWEGLGYYSRARNMQAAAQTVMTDYNGQFPENYDEILKLKGIGPYTAGALASIAFGQPVPAVDGNVMRVFGRMFTITLDIRKGRTQRVYREIIQQIISKDRPGAFNQALMDLGSSYERAKNPDSAHSPIRDFNLATLTDTAENFPVKSKLKKPKTLYFRAHIYETPSHRVVITQRKDERLLHGMWMVPLEETTVDTAQVQETHTVYDETTETLGEVKHVFSHQIWQIVVDYTRVSEAEGEKLAEGTDTELIAVSESENYPFPTVQNKIWALLDEKHAE